MTTDKTLHQESNSPTKESKRKSKFNYCHCGVMIDSPLLTCSTCSNGCTCQ